MKNRRLITTLFALLIATALLALPTLSTRAQKSSNDSDPLAKVRAEWAAGMLNKQPEKVAMLYAEDAAFLKPDGTRITGRAAIRVLCKTMMAIFTSDITFHSVASERSGNLAYDSGNYTETLTNLSDGTKMTPSGTYLTVLKRQPNGSWLITQQMWSGPSVASH
jgi:uncharacterized protein (TIGR02246 family)